MNNRDKDKNINSENDDNEYGEHDNAIERFLENPDAVITRGCFRYLLKVKSGCIADISEVEQMLYDTATDFEYHLHGLDVGVFCTSPKKVYFRNYSPSANWEELFSLRYRYTVAFDKS